MSQGRQRGRRGQERRAQRYAPGRSAVHTRKGAFLWATQRRYGRIPSSTIARATERAGALRLRAEPATGDATSPDRMSVAWLLGCVDRFARRECGGRRQTSLGKVRTTMTAPTSKVVPTPRRRVRARKVSIFELIPAKKSTVANTIVIST